ncbi:MAG: cytochrome c oxidase accessory protein CcoG [Candidatus Marinarcus sp.]|uniref:cytochrome c oxidase accessory protein CcoG n=1 Tax=Candidatus Marinarcus sp. TaxID=3100987 RepID=UPI003B0097CB
MTYKTKRYCVYLFITLFSLILPFITINENHMLLLSFDKMLFQFAGFSFEMQELYIMPFLLMILFIGIFVMTTIGGRIWCSWACPQTIFRVLYRDLIESKLFKLRKISNKQKDIDYTKYSNQIKKVLATTVFLLLGLIISVDFMWYFVPPEDFFAYMQKPTEHIFMILFILSTTLFLFYTVVLAKEDYCVYFCPYSRIQSVLYDDNTVQVIYDTNRGGNIYTNGEKSIFKAKEFTAQEECTTCESCVKVCPTHIDIRKGFQVECINCLECADACTDVMGKLGKPSLISWGSTNAVLHKTKTVVYSAKNIMYFVSIFICIALMALFASGKESILLNVNKTTSLYKINNEKRVRNNYIFTIQNREKETLTYDIKVNNPNFRVKNFKTFKLQPNQRVKKVVIIESTKTLSLSAIKDTPIGLQVIVFAKENPEKFNLTQTVSFIYPRDSLLK